VPHIAVSIAGADYHAAFYANKTYVQMDWHMGWTTCSFVQGRAKGLFLPPERRERLWGPRSFLFSGCWDSFPGIKRLEHPSTGKVKNGWSDASTSPIFIQDNFTVTYVV
jgi:hypothetical protein